MGIRSKCDCTTFSTRIFLIKHLILQQSNLHFGNESISMQSTDRFFVFIFILVTNAQHTHTIWHTHTHWTPFSWCFYIYIQYSCICLLLLEFHFLSFCHFLCAKRNNLFRFRYQCRMMSFLLLKIACPVFVRSLFLGKEIRFSFFGWCFEFGSSFIHDTFAFAIVSEHKESYKTWDERKKPCSDNRINVPFLTLTNTNI